MFCVLVAHDVLSTALCLVIVGHAALACRLDTQEEHGGSQSDLSGHTQRLGCGGANAISFFWQRNRESYELCQRFAFSFFIGQSEAVLSVGVRTGAGVVRTTV
jgi:hypothetical protein